MINHSADHRFSHDSRDAQSESDQSVGEAVVVVFATVVTSSPYPDIITLLLILLKKSFSEN
jgi:hypothetical protein